MLQNVPYYELRKTFEISAAHKLELSYQSKCEVVHGHNWKIEVEVGTEELNKDGMVIDFTHLKKVVMRLDHGNLNNMIENPTAERIAKYLHEEIERALEVYNPDASVTQITVTESEGNVICFTP